MGCIKPCRLEFFPKSIKHLDFQDKQLMHNITPINVNRVMEFHKVSSKNKETRLT